MSALLSSVLASSKNEKQTRMILHTICSKQLWRRNPAATANALMNFSTTTATTNNNNNTKINNIPQSTVSSQSLLSSRSSSSTSEVLRRATALLAPSNINVQYRRYSYNARSLQPHNRGVVQGGRGGHQGGGGGGGGRGGGRTAAGGGYSGGGVYQQRRDQDPYQQESDDYNDYYDEYDDEEEYDYDPNAQYRRARRDLPKQDIPKVSEFIIRRPMTVRELGQELGLKKQSILNAALKNANREEERREYYAWKREQDQLQFQLDQEYQAKAAALKEKGQKIRMKQKILESTYLNRRERLSRGMETLSIQEIEEVCYAFDVLPRMFTDVFDDPVPFSKTNKQEDPDAPERAPVVTIMGHVDHGKTTLLDTIRKTDVAAHEAGGITQHIGAFEVSLENGQQITFIDTPGHEAFIAMRAAGANVTDLIILVVAADDGVMPQTIEAINHARQANVPIIVAVNKIDKPSAKPELIKTQLAKHGIIPEEMGGREQFVHISAKTGENIDELLEVALLQAAELNLRAKQDNVRAEAAIIESRIDRGLGNIVTVIVQRGILQTGQWVVAGQSYGKIKHISDHRGAKLDKALPSQPVEIAGLNSIPKAGEFLIQVESEQRAIEIVEHRINKAKLEAELKQSASTSTSKQATTASAVQTATATAMARIKSAIGSDADIKILPIIVRADVQGTLEAIREIINNFPRKEVGVEIIFEGIGAISEADISLASSFKAHVFGLNAKAPASIVNAAREAQVPLKTYKIIYQLIDEIKEQLSNMLTPIEEEAPIAHAEVKALFDINGKKRGEILKVVGCTVKDGNVVLKRGPALQLIKVIRRGRVVGRTAMLGLRRFKDEVKEVPVGQECGIQLVDPAVDDISGVTPPTPTPYIVAHPLDNEPSPSTTPIWFTDVRPGDVLELYTLKKVKRSFDSIIQQAANAATPRTRQAGFKK